MPAGRSTSASTPPNPATSSTCRRLRKQGEPAMTVLTATAGKWGARAKSRAAGFRVELVQDWKQAAARWDEFSPSTPFQHPQWCQAWYSAFADASHVEPLI